MEDKTNKIKCQVFNKWLTMEKPETYCESLYRVLEMPIGYAAAQNNEMESRLVDPKDREHLKYLPGDLELYALKIDPEVRLPESTKIRPPPKLVFLDFWTMPNFGFLEFGFWNF